MADTSNRKEFVCTPEDELVIRMFLNLSQRGKDKSEGYISCLTMVDDKQEQKTA